MALRQTLARPLVAGIALPSLLASIGVAGVAASSTASAATCATDATWTTQPKTILVYRKALNRVERVDFRYYVKNVLPNEWIASWPTESLHAGAHAVKTFAWHKTLTSTKKAPNGQCYHVADTTADQVYKPGSALAATSKAVDDTWNERLLKGGKVFSAHYCAVAYQCTYWVDGQWLSQYGSRDMARQPGMTHAKILTKYYAGATVTR